MVVDGKVRLEPVPMPVQLGLTTRNAVVDVPTSHRALGIEVVESAGGRGQHVIYGITGRVLSRDDYHADTGTGPFHAGCEVLLDTGEYRVLTRVRGRAASFDIGASVWVTGGLAALANHECADLGLPDIRVPWIVEEVIRAGEDYQVRLRPDLAA